MRSNPKILIVDDDFVTQAILKKIFETPVRNAGKALILPATDGLMALAMLENNPGTDVIILDLEMPGMHGFDFLELIRQDLRFQPIPVCVLCGNQADAVKALELGAHDFISKPGHNQEIFLRISNLIRNKIQIEASELAKSDFLATVSHEFRTPMNGVIGMTSLLQTTELSEEQVEYITILEDASHNMMTVIDNAIGFLRSENPVYSLPQVSFEFRNTVETAVESLRPDALKNKVSLEFDFDPKIPVQLIGLPEKIQLIFKHLVSNCIKFTHSGKVVIACKKGEREKNMLRLHCSVHDTGIGIPPEAQSLIFQPFSQADNSATRKFGGLGISLSIASRMVQMLGGRINIESQVGAGSTFSFTIHCGCP